MEKSQIAQLWPGPISKPRGNSKIQSQLPYQIHLAIQKTKNRGNRRLLAKEVVEQPKNTRKNFERQVSAPPATIDYIENPPSH